MNYFHILLLILAFAAGAGTGQYVVTLPRTVEAEPAPQLTQYSCAHARSTGNFSQLKGCL